MTTINGPGKAELVLTAKLFLIKVLTDKSQPVTIDPFKTQN